MTDSIFIGVGLTFATPLAAVILVPVNMLHTQDFIGERESLPSRGRRLSHGKSAPNHPSYKDD